MLSKENIKRVKSLHKKKARDEQGLFIIEGEKILKEAFAYRPDSIQTIYTSKNLSFNPENAQIISVSEQELQRISTLKQPRGVLAICTYLKTKENTADFILALDKIQDPGNMGTIIRLAAWFGIQEIIASEDTVDCYNPKVVQATMGALFNVNIRYTDLRQYFSKNKLPVYGALLKGENIYNKPLHRKGILLMGNEGNGIREELLGIISHPLTIPRLGHGESLNVAMATGIFLSEFSRKEA